MEELLRTLRLVLLCLFMEETGGVAFLLLSSLSLTLGPCSLVSKLFNSSKVDQLMNFGITFQHIWQISRVALKLTLRNPFLFNCARESRGVALGGLEMHEEGT